MPARQFDSITLMIFLSKVWQAELRWSQNDENSVTKVFFYNNTFFLNSSWFSLQPVIWKIRQRVLIEISLFILCLAVVRLSFFKPIWLFKFLPLTFLDNYYETSHYFMWRFYVFKRFFRLALFDMDYLLFFVWWYLFTDC